MTTTLRTTAFVLNLLATVSLLSSCTVQPETKVWLDEDFSQGQALSGWKFTPETSWSIDTLEGVIGKGSLKVAGDGMKSYADASVTFEFDSLRGEFMRLGGWVKTEKVNYRRDAIVELTFSGEGFTYTLSQYNRNTPFSYLERTFRVPPGLDKGTLTIKFYGSAGTAWIDGLRLESVDEPLIAELPKENRYDIVEKRLRSDGNWAAPELPYRITGSTDDNSAGAPVWADLDFARLLLAAGQNRPVDPASVRIFAVDTDGKKTDCPVSFGDPLSSLSDHYLRNGTLKWKAPEGAAGYEIYFAASHAEGPRPQAGNLNLGVGELLTYDASEPNMSWLGWPGMQFEAVDADGDGDFDIYGIRTDGGTWLQRNIGSNSEPRFLPRSRALPTDRLPSPELSYITLDWDGDGVSDRVRFRRHPRTNRYHNMKGDIVVELTRNGKRTPQVVHTPDGRPVEFPNSSWSALKAADMDNDGRPDLLVGTANSDLFVLTNKGVDGELPVAEVNKVPFGYFGDDPYISGDMSLKPFPLDWDGDGYTDIVCTAWQGFYWLFRNKGVQGSLEFEEPIRFFQQGGVLVHNDSPTPYAVDWDDDGDLDLISGGCGGNIMLFENTGTPTQPNYKGGVFLQDDSGEPFFFNAVENGGTVQGMEEQYWGYLSCVPRDVDGDGDLDIIISDCLGKVRWIENTGTRQKPVLSKNVRNFYYGNQPLVTPWRNRPGVADWNGDGRLDFIVLDDRSDLVMYSQSAHNPEVLENKRKLRKADGSVFHIGRLTHPGGQGRFNMDVADWNGDGRLDLIMGEPRNYLGGGNMTIAINVGTNEDPVFEYDYMMARGGYFVEWTGSDGHDAWHCCMPCVFDFDGDGRPDLLVGTESGRISLYSHDYFDGEKFPIFKAANFDRKQGNKVFRILDFENLTEKTKGLNTRNVQLQKLPEQSEEYLTGEGIKVEIVSPTVGIVLSGKVPYVATVTGNKSVTGVDFYINGEKICTEKSAPYVAYGDDNLWDTAEVPDGHCILKVIVHTADGESYETESGFEVKNK